MSDPRALAGRHAPDLHGATPPSADVRRRHDADLQYALRGLDPGARDRFLADYADALRAFERALAEREAGALYGRNPLGAPTFSPGTLAVFEDKARIDLEIRRRATRVLQPWQGWRFAALVVVVVLVVWLR